jgi:rRNA-processing protein FCF1
VIEYAKINKMILITKDRENGQYCNDHSIPCVWLSDEKLFEKMVLPRLKELQKIND